jgi:transketolase
MKFDEALFTDKEKKASTRDGFGLGILAAGEKDKNVVVLAADLAGSLKLGEFIKKYPERFVQVGVAEQNLVTVASGLAHIGKIPFVTSFAAFSPGRNWEQIRTTICYNNQPVKIVGGHTGLSVGEDGATHQMLEDIALMRVLPNIQVIVPCDFTQAKQATQAIAKTRMPAYIRLTRHNTSIILSEKESFEIGKIQVLKEGTDLVIFACGPLVYDCLKAANELEKELSIMVVNVHTIQPLDTTIIQLAKKTKKILTVEDHSIKGGLGSAIAELLSKEYPVKITMMGMDGFGESGKETELYAKYGLHAKGIMEKIRSTL